VSVLHLELLGRLKLHQQDVTLLVQQLEPVLLQLQTVLFHLEPVTLEPVTLIQQEWTCVQLVLPRLNCWIHLVRVFRVVKRVFRFAKVLYSGCTFYRGPARRVSVFRWTLVEQITQGLLLLPSMAAFFWNEPSPLECQVPHRRLDKAFKGVTVTVDTYLTTYSIASWNKAWVPSPIL
jgi:hypothetical protein